MITADSALSALRAVVETLPSDEYRAVRRRLAIEADPDTGSDFQRELWTALGEILDTVDDSIAYGPEGES